MFPNYHDLLKTALELYIKDCLERQRNDLYNYAVSQARWSCDPDLEQFEAFNKIFLANNIDVMGFSEKLMSVLTKRENKINCIRLIGVPNSGKTLIGNCIVKPFICCYMNNHGSENEFFLSNMLNKSIILCEELYVTTATCEDFKSILGGQPIDISKKFNEKQMLSRTPVILTSNHKLFGRNHLGTIDEQALALRCHTFEFTAEVCPEIQLDWQQFYLYIWSHITQ